MMFTPQSLLTEEKEMEEGEARRGVMGTERMGVCV